jgi:hypothetical protein
MNSTKSSDDLLLEIAVGNMSNIKKNNLMIVNGPRLINKILRQLVEKYRKQGLNGDQIIEKLLDYDLLIENGKVTQEDLTQKINNKA